MLKIIQSYNHYLTICCIVKDENESLEEWINYHRKIGVQQFYIYDNESKKSVKQTLQKAGLIKYELFSQNVKNRLIGHAFHFKSRYDCN
ncbi:hypothetical protein FEM33_12710 [Dyadobacter flavalbus]|uniref:Glycosyltransferase family 2 protein n=1 Tax=Dyadobacter flavalbus TaxID=2579942 RepID=A0A5M8QV17_9BACT|nr:hypothetical protein FEM33_12710 [Dyadobacter flavalbus]